MVFLEVGERWGEARGGSTILVCPKRERYIRAKQQVREGWGRINSDESLTIAVIISTFASYRPNQRLCRSTCETKPRRLHDVGDVDRCALNGSFAAPDPAPSSH